MITKFDNYKLNEDIDKEKIKLSIKLFYLVDLIGGSADLDDINICYRTYVFSKVYIKNDDSANNLFVEFSDFLTKKIFDLHIEKLTIYQILNIFEYLKDKYPDEYNQIILKEDSKKFNI